MSRRWAIFAIAALLMVGACDRSPAADSLSDELLSEHGLRPAGATNTRELEIWKFAEDGMPWAAYLEASRQVGLDFAAQRGLRAELRTTPLEGDTPELRAHVLVKDGAVIGAWLSSEDTTTGSSEIYPLDTLELG